MIGRTLSHYKVLEKIGEGGMGEVYLAKDTKLDREVAVKVLPATFSENKERLARFEREAKLLASLNHSNIAAIHELEESAVHPANLLIIQDADGDGMGSFRLTLDTNLTFPAPR